LEQTPATATFYGAHSYDYLGMGIACGDVNGDGQPDLLLTAPGADTSQNIQFSWGMAYLFYGGSLSGVKDLRVDSADFRVIGNRTLLGGASLGVSASLGDVNGDGYKDLVLGTRATAFDTFPDVVVIFGGNLRGTLDLNSRSPDFGIESPSGWNIGTVTSGDVNGDGIDDIIMASPFAPGPGGRLNSGAVYIVYGRRGLTGRRYLATDPPDVTIYGADEGDEMGYQGAGPNPAIYAGDINHDGSADLVVTAFAADGPGNTRSACGEIYVFYSGSLPREWDLHYSPADLTLYGKESGSYLDVGLIGDVNGDGYGDLLMGEEGEEFGKGVAFLLYGGSPPPRGIRDLAVDSMDYTIVGIDTNDLMSSNLALADVNNDGKQDLLINAPFGAGPGNTRPHGGEDYLIFGGDLRGLRDLRTTPPDWTFYGRFLSDYHLGRFIKGGNVTGGSNSEVILAGGQGPSGPPPYIRDGAQDVHVLDLQDLIGVETLGQNGGSTLGPVRATPNPFSSFATVPGHEGERFALYDISGRLVGKYRGDRVGEGLSAGVYFLKPDKGVAKPLRIVKLR